MSSVNEWVCRFGFAVVHVTLQPATDFENFATVRTGKLALVFLGVLFIAMSLGSSLRRERRPAEYAAKNISFNCLNYFFGRKETVRCGCFISREELTTAWKQNRREKEMAPCFQCHPCRRPFRRRHGSTDERRHALHTRSSDRSRKPPTERDF